jgi:PAS domain-containing protein
MSAAAPPSLATLVDRLRELGVADEVAPELDAVREELAASVAQLDAANTELVAAAQELDTTGAELRRAADELRAMDEELRDRSADVERAAAILQAVIDGLDGAIVVVDGDQKVRAWSAGATRRWGHGSSEVQGKLVGRLDLGGDAAPLAALARRTIAGTDQADADLGARSRPLPNGGAVVIVEP